MSSSLRTSFQGKLNRVIGFSLILSLLIMAVTVNLIERKYSRQSLVRELEVISDMFANRSLASLMFFDQIAAEKNLVSAQFHKSIDTLCLYDGKNQLFAKFERIATEQCAEVLSQYESAEKLAETFENKKNVEYLSGKTILLTPVIDNSFVMGYIVLQANERELISEQLRLTSVLIILFSLTLILTYLFTRKIIGGLLKPLHMLSQTARTISRKGTIGERAERLSDDEIGDLVETFNHMLESIERENEALYQSESRFRVLAENAPIGIYLKDHNNTLLYVNGKWKDITGFEEECSHSTYLSAIAESDVVRYEKFLEVRANNKKTRMIEYKFRREGSLRESVVMEYLTPIAFGRDDERVQECRFYWYIG